MMQHLTNAEIIDYLHNALPTQQDAGVYAHLEQCAQCREQHDAEAALTEMLRGYASQRELDLPPMLKAQIWSRIRAAQPTPWDRLAALWRPALAIPVLAALAIGLYFGTAAGPGAPSIDAAYYLQDHAAMSGLTPFSDRSVDPMLMQSEATRTTAQTAAIAPPVTADVVP
jgi:predicted anti-sigma-YlaC factor YlaD